MQSHTVRNSLSFLLLLLFLSRIHAAADIKQGGWDLHLTGFVRGAATPAYKVLADEKRQECFSNSYLEGNPFQNPERERRLLEPNFGICSVAAQSITAAVASWTIDCATAGERTKIETINTFSEDGMVLLTETATTNAKGEVVQVRMLQEYQYLGACTPRMSNR